MVSDYFTRDLQTLCRSVAKSLEEMREYTRELIFLDLSEQEERFLTSVYPPDPKDVAGTLLQYERFVPLLRGDVDGARPWLTDESVKSMVLSDKILASDAFAMRLIRSMYLWQTDDYHLPVLQFLRKIEDYTNRSFDFKDVPEPFARVYNNSVVMLMVNYLQYLPSDYRGFLFGGPLFFLAINNGLDIDQALKNAVGSLEDDQFRLEYSYTTAALINTNPVLIGKDSHEKNITLSVWIDAFSDVSKKNFDSDSLQVFADDKDRWHFCSEGEKMTILFAVYLYARLLNGWYVVANFRLQTVDWKKFFTKEVLTSIDIENLLEWVGEQENIESVKKYWREKLRNVSFESDIFLQNITTVSNGIESDFDTEPMVYFDDKSGSFRWFE